MRLRLDNADTGGNGLQLVPETYGMDVPSACTIVIIAGLAVRLIMTHSVVFYMSFLNLKLDKKFKIK